MNVGFVCTNYNNSSHTREFIASLRAGRRWEDVRVVVVDNKSRDGDVAVLKSIGLEFPEVELVFHPDNVGYFPGLNIGIRHLRRKFPEIEHVIIGNNDLLFPETFVETLQGHREVFDQWAVVSPDLVTPDGAHQNPHVLQSFSPIRQRILDLYFVSYGIAAVILRLARITRRFTVRPELAPGSEFFKTPGPIKLGLGACYLLGPVFFRHFGGLCAPTFMMQEEFFLSEQLKLIGQVPYYDPRFVVTHFDHASTDELPGRHYWQISREAHLVNKRYLSLPAAKQAEFITSATMEPD